MLSLRSGISQKTCVPLRKISEGVPSSVMAEMKEARRESVTGKTDICRSAIKYSSVVDWRPPANLEGGGVEMVRLFAAQ